MHKIQGRGWVAEGSGRRVYARVSTPGRPEVQPPVRSGFFLVEVKINFLPVHCAATALSPPPPQAKNPPCRHLNPPMTVSTDDSGVALVQCSKTSFLLHKIREILMRSNNSDYQETH
ncbi:hypothetical protein BsWGS_24850 [Bradybaena similaris]